MKVETILESLQIAMSNMKIPHLLQMKYLFNLKVLREQSDKHCGNHPQQQLFLPVTQE
jgi:hypothetical protein